MRMKKGRNLGLLQVARASVFVYAYVYARGKMNIILSVVEKMIKSLRAGSWTPFIS